MQFIDECIIQLKAGNGGNGIVAWRREAHNPHGGPYGGDGGDGGNIIFVGDHNTTTLMPLRNHKIISANNGENGKTKLATGKNGQDKIIKLPLGTVIYDLDENKIIAEILKHNQKILICSGGKGGHGNGWFKNSKNKIPNLHENGDIGQYRNVKLTIKYIADIGFVGLPNAGKSSIINALTSAKPKIANYSFTTLIPVLGTFIYKNEKIVFADIPGLIKGASQGEGLGHDFLKHIERCVALIHVISLSIIDNYDIVDSYKVICNELAKYSKHLVDKPTILICNKVDLPESQKQFKKLSSYLKNKNILCISAREKINLDKLSKLIYDLFIKSKKPLLDSNDTQVKIYQLNKREDYEADIEIIQKDEGIWEVKSKYLKYWSNRIPLDTSDNIIYFNTKLKNIDLENKIKLKGGKVGDQLLIYGKELIIE